MCGTIAGYLSRTLGRIFLFAQDPMKNCLKISLAALGFLLAGGAAVAQSSVIYRCGNEYTNAKEAERRGGCRVVEGGNVTVVEGMRPAPAAAASGAAPVVTAPPGAPRVNANEQKARDADARAILEVELRKAEARQAELLKEYNNGEPDKLGPETRNHQKYLDRVAELKAAIARNESDIAGIKRELGRVPATR